MSAVRRILKSIYDRSRSPALRELEQRVAALELKAGQGGRLYYRDGKLVMVYGTGSTARYTTIVGDE